MKKTFKKGILSAVVLSLVVGMLFVPGIGRSREAQAASGYKISSALKYAAVKLGLGKSGSTFTSCRAALIEAGVLVDGDYKDYNALMTRTDAAVLADRIMDFMGEEKDKERIALVQELGRIADLDKVAKAKRDAVARVFSDGVVTGSGLGQYTQNRNFKGREKLDAATAQRIIRTAMGKGTRKQMSPDGQVIRTTSLPVNASEYPYILQNFPNKFYEKKFEYEFVTYSYKPKEVIDYTTPARIPYKPQADMLEEYRYIWAEKIKKNIELRLNVDYRTIDDNWAKELAGTYAHYTDKEYNEEKLEEIRAYVKTVKKNKVIVESKLVVVEPSTMYAYNGLNYRSKVKFRIKAGNNIDKNAMNSIYRIYVDQFKIGQWIEGEYDLNIAWKATLNPEGKDAGVSRDAISDRRAEYKNKIITPKKQIDSNYIFQ